VDFTEGYNNHNYMHHLFDEYTKAHLVETTVHNGHGMTLEILEYWYNYIKGHYKSKIRYIRLDGERTLQVQFETWCRHKDPPIIIERTPPYTQEPRAGAEGAHRVVNDGARALRISGRLPENLWPETVRAEAHILLRLPTKALN
jgi:hypothetical protein